MQSQEIIQILENKIRCLQERRTSMVISGDISEVVKIDLEIQETQKCLNDLCGASVVANNSPVVENVVEKPTQTKTAESLLNGENGALLKNAVMSFVQYIGMLQAEGVILPQDMTFYNMIVAIELCYGEETIQAVNKGLKLRILWDNIVFYCGTLKEAYELWPDLLRICMSN